VPQINNPTRATGAVQSGAEPSASIWRWKPEPPPSQGSGNALRRMLKPLVQALAISLISGVVWWRGHHSVAIGLWVLAGCVVGLGLVFPAAYVKVDRAWRKVGKGAGMVIGVTLLTVLYYVLFLPVALVLRALGKDRLRLTFPGSEASYWTDLPPQTNAAEAAEHQF